MSHAIEADHLTRVYRGRGGLPPVLANDDLCFTVERGEIFGLLGANGAGKSTLVLQIMGLVRPTSGAVRVAGIDVAVDPDAVRRTVGFLPQRGVAMRMLEVERALRYTGCLRGQAEAEARAQARELMDELELAAVADRPVDKLSGGLVRLTNVAMAMMGRPQVLVLDEPTNELDPHNRRRVWDAIARRNAEGVTCVLVTHNVLEAERVVHRVGVMRGGRLIDVGTPGELKQRAGGRVRLEVELAAGAVLGDTARAALAGVGELVEHGNRIRLHLDRDRLADGIAVATTAIGLDGVDDFRLAPPSLEDVYLDLDRDSAAPPPATPALRREAAARPAPAAPLRIRVRRELSAFRWLVTEQLLELRATWMWSALFAVLMPIAMVFGLARIGTGLSDHESLLYIVSGAAVFAVSTEALLTLAQRVGAMRQDGMLTYYASLPIGKTAFVGALVASRMLIVVPGLLVPVAAGAALYGLPITPSPWALVLLPLACLSLATIGVVLGSLIESMELIVIVTNLVIFVLLLASPVLIPVDALPAPLQILGHLLPPTYAADGMRRALTGDIGTRFAIDIAVLLAMTATSMLALGRWLRWQLAR